jgi:GcrA cell cycle regulator
MQVRADPNVGLQRIDGGGYRPSSPWNPTLDGRLAELRAAGLSAAKIGEQLGFSKNAVVGRSLRTGLPRLPSPILRGTSHAAATPRAIPRLCDLVPLISLRGLCPCCGRP